MAEATYKALGQLKISGGTYRIAAEDDKVTDTELSGPLTLWVKSEGAFGGSDWDLLSDEEAELLWPKVVKDMLKGTWNRLWGDPS